jgi:ABC-type sugar transport system substrate-binding protein/AraC-like DNA-binding protein
MLVLAGCTPDAPHRHIGISQCSEDIWRDWQNAEMKLESTFHDDVQLSFTTAHDDSHLQSQQIDSLVAAGIDLLIVAPNQLQSVTPAIDKAFDSGIPVIVFERKTDSHKYTAFVSADNYEMGRQMGSYIASKLDGRGSIMEVMGLKGSSPATERHNGFRDALRNFPDINVVATLQGDWTETMAYDEVKRYLASHSTAGIDIVFGHNDRMAMGARRAFAERLSARDTLSSLPLFCGIDGLPGADGGIRQVRDSLLCASYIYPTRGDLVLQLALDILQGRPYQKETMLTSALVTPDNAKVLLLESDEVMRRSQKLELLQAKVSNYLHQIAIQRIAMLLFCGVLVLLMVAMVLFYLYHRGKVNLRRERVVNNLWSLPSNIDNAAPRHTSGVPTATAATPTDVAISGSSPTGVTISGTSPAGVTISGTSPAAADTLPTAAAPAPATAAVTAEPEAGETPAMASAADGTAPCEPACAPPPTAAPDDGDHVPQFIARFRDVVERRMTESELSVEDLAADMHLSRVQLYRKVKALTGSSPVELLRTARLNHGYQLLVTTDKTVAEVAYDVGFSAPAYFTKCFKDEFGMVPGDVRKM